ncbi:MAG: hypothetical protein JO053_13670 [Acidobacteria bacterium]|nr:hypothetical protein [Acidobacteriota bacterium]
MKLLNPLPVLLLGACLLNIIPSAPAQAPCPSAPADPLMKQWVANEGDWNAIWDPVSAPTTRADGARVANYRGAWSKPTGFGHYSSSEEKVQGTLTIAVNGNVVEIDRVETPNMRNTCHYRGTVIAPDRVRGSYTCSYHSAPLRWQARILTPTSAFCAANEPRLSVVWHETEGDWRAEWTPTGAPGHFNASYRKGRETTQATVTVEITENDLHNRVVVRARRTQALGTCDYDGFLTGAGGATNADGWTVNGRYQCTWGGGNLPWSAIIGAGHP